MARGAPPARTTCVRCGTPIAPPRLKTCGGECEADDLRLMLAELGRRRKTLRAGIVTQTGLVPCGKCGRPVLPDGTPGRAGGTYCSEMCPGAKTRRAASRAKIAAGIEAARSDLPLVVIDHINRRRRTGGSRP